MPPPAAPTSTKEQLGAALQTAGQYAGGSTVWTPQNAEELGLDPSRGYIAKGTPVPPPHPQQPGPQPGPLPPAPPSPPEENSNPVEAIVKQLLETKVPGTAWLAPLVPKFGEPPPKDGWNPFPELAEGLKTPITDLPKLWQKSGQQKEPTEPAKKGETAPSTEEIKIPGATEVKSATADAGSAEEIKIPGATEVKPATTDTVSSAEEIKIPGATEVKPVEQAPAQAQPEAQQPEKPETPMPSGTGAGAPQGVSAPLVPGRDAHISALIASGKTPGEAQAIADGQEAKTLTGETPQPKPPEPKTEQKPAPTLSPEDQAEAKELAQNEFNLPPAQRHPEWLGPNARAEYDKLVAGTSQPSQPSAPTTTTEEPPKVAEGNKIQGTSTIFGLNYDQSIDPDDNGRGFFGGVNTRDPKLKAVAVPVDVLEKTFGHFAQLNAKGGYDMVDTPEARAVVKAIQSAHVEVPDENGKIHKFPIVDIQGSLKGHPGKVLDFTWGAAHEMGFTDNHKISYQIIGGDGKPYPIPDNIKFAAGGGGGGGDKGGGGGGGLPPPGGQPAGQPMVSIPSAGGTPQLSGGGPRGGGWSGDTGYGGGREASSRTAEAPISLTSLLEAAAGGAAAGSLFRGGGGQPRAQRPAEEEPPPPPPAGGMKPANVLGVRTISPAGPPPPAPSSLQAQLLPPPAAPTAAAQPATPPSLPPIKGPDPAVVKALMKRGFTRQQAEAFAAKATVSKPGAAAITGGASFKPPAQPAAKQAPPAPALPAKTAPPPAAAPPAKQVPAPPQPREATRIGPEGSTIGVPNPPGSEAITKWPRLVDQAKQHAAILSPDDPRVKKQADGKIKGEHFVPGDPMHEQLLNGLPNGQQGRQRQLLAQAEEAIAEKRPMHISYLSAPKEAAKFPTRESRRIQYDEHSPEARLMGTTEGQLVGHSFIPVSVGITPSGKASEPHQSVIHGLSTNVIANNFAHLNTKLAAMGRKTPYASFGPKFVNDLEGYLHNLNAGHTGTGRGYALGTEEHPSEPDTSHVPYKLTRHEADFLNAVINNTGAFAKHEDAQALRELARVNGTLITPQGETNRLLHEIEQHEPGWSGRGSGQRGRVLEPSIRSFSTGLIHEVHPSEEHMPATIRPGQDYKRVTEAMRRTSERGRPDVPVAASVHHTFADNKAINQIERDFSQERITEQEARARLKALGEDPDQFQFIGGSGGLITPYEENPEAITPEEHTELKTNLRKQWIGGKMPIEDYRRKAAEVPLPEKPSQPPASSPAAPETETAPSPKPITPVKPKPPKPQPEPEPEPVEAKETPETPPAAPKPAAPIPKAKPAPKALQQAPEASMEEPKTQVEPSRVKNSYAASGDKVHWLPTDEVEKRWQKDKDFYIPPGGTENTIGKRYAAAKEHLQSDKPVNAPRAHVDETGKISMVDGRHRLAAMRDLGHQKVPLALVDDAVENATKTGLISKATQEPEEPAKLKEPPAPGDILPPAKPKKAAKTKEQSGLEAQDFEQAAADRDNISPEDAARLTRIQKIAKGWVKKNPNLHDLSMHAYLTGQKKFPGKLNKEQIGEHFDATNPKLDYSKEEHRQKAADAIVHDIMHSLAGTTTGRPSTAYGWYDRTVRKTMAKIGEIAPEILTDPDHALAFKLALAITSQGQDVFPNAESAWHIYQHWLKHDEMPTDRKVFGGGIKAEAMEQNLAKVNDLWKEHGTEGLHKILMSRMTSRELREKYGLDSGEKADHVVNGAMGLGAKIGAFFSNLNGDFDPTTIDLWFSRNMNLMAGNMFGFSDKAMRQDRMEKGEVVKSHLSELRDLLQSGMISNIPQERADKMAQELAALQAHPEGKLDRPTAKALAPEIYNWAREQHRTYQRSYGGKAEGEQKGSYHKDFKTRDNLVAKKLDEATTGLSDDPRTTTERDHWRDIMARADKSLKSAKVHLTNADKQALLWFNIKDLFKMAGSPQRPKADYLDAAHRLVRKVKSGELPGLAQSKQPAGGVLKMAGGGFVQDPGPDPEVPSLVAQQVQVPNQPSEVPGPMQGQTQPLNAPSQGATQPLNAPSQPAQAPPPAAPTGGAFTPMPQETGKVPIPNLNTKFDPDPDAPYLKAAAGGGAGGAQEQGSFPGAVRTMSMWMPGQRLRHDLKYGALQENGHDHLMTNNDIAMSPDLMKKYGYNLGDRVDVLDSHGNVLYPNQLIADKSYLSPGKPTSNTIELWGRKDVGYSSIRPAQPAD
jgi:hypothetical protein